MMGGYLSLTKPSAPKGVLGGEAVVRMILKATVVQVEAKKPAGKWEKLSSTAYAAIIQDEDTGMPSGLGLDTMPGLRMLMQENRDRQVFAKMGK
jgi:hypothetical protein